MLNSKKVFSTRAFEQCIQTQLPEGVDAGGAVRDFVGLAIMMGNDYLPGCRLGVGPEGRIMPSTTRRLRRVNDTQDPTTIGC